MTPLKDTTASGPAVTARLDVDVSRAGGAWEGDAEEIATRVAQVVFEHHADFENEDAGGVAGLNILLADDAFVQTLNRKFRGRDTPTNVLSFPHGPGQTERLLGAARPLGDIALACETLGSEAKTQGKTFNDHLAHLVVHGVLHLLGYDHEIEAEALAMEACERAILARLGIADPYEEKVSRDEGVDQGTREGGQ